MEDNREQEEEEQRAESLSQAIRAAKTLAESELRKSTVLKGNLGRRSEKLTKCNTREEALRWLKERNLTPPYDHQTWHVGNQSVNFPLESIFDECEKIYAEEYMKRLATPDERRDHTIHLSPAIKVNVNPRFGVKIRIYLSEQLLYQELDNFAMFKQQQ